MEMSWHKMLIVEDNRVALATSEFPPTTWELIMPLHNNATQPDHDECAVFIFFFSFFFLLIRYVASPISRRIFGIARAQNHQAEQKNKKTICFYRRNRRNMNKMLTKEGKAGQNLRIHSPLSYLCIIINVYMKPHTCWNWYVHTRKLKTYHHTNYLT